MHVPPVIRSVSKTSKIVSFNGQTRFCLMSIVAQVTPGTVGVRISDAVQC